MVLFSQGGVPLSVYTQWTKKDARRVERKNHTKISQKINLPKMVFSHIVGTVSVVDMGSTKDSGHDNTGGREP